MLGWLDPLFGGIMAKITFEFPDEQTAFLVLNGLGDGIEYWKIQINRLTQEKKVYTNQYTRAVEIQDKLQQQQNLLFSQFNHQMELTELQDSQAGEFNYQAQFPSNGQMAKSVVAD